MVTSFQSDVLMVFCWRKNDIEIDLSSIVIRLILQLLENPFIPDQELFYLNCSQLFLLRANLHIQATYVILESLRCGRDDKCGFLELSFFYCEFSSFGEHELRLGGLRSRARRRRDGFIENDSR